MNLDFAVLPQREQVAPDQEAFNVWMTEVDRRWIEFYRQGEGYLLRFPKLADFEVSSDGCRIAAAPAPHVGAGTLQHLYLNQVMPLALNRQGRLTIHASTIAAHDWALAFLGASGRGKSTLAASFALSGFPFLTEDVMVVERNGHGFLALPSHPSVRLWEDSEAELIRRGAEEILPVEYTSKVRFLAGGGLAHCDRPMPLRAAYHLGEGTANSVEIEPIPPSTCVIEIIKQSPQLDIEDAAALKRHFTQVAEFCAAVPCYKLDYPRDYRELGAVRAAILAHASELERA